MYASPKVSTGATSISPSQLLGNGSLKTKEQSFHATGESKFIVLWAHYLGADHTLDVRYVLSEELNALLVPWGKAKRGYETSRVRKTPGTSHTGVLDVFWSLLGTLKFWCNRNGSRSLRLMQECFGACHKRIHPGFQVLESRGRTQRHQSAVM